MPSWQPNWSDVRFDHLSAAAAVDALVGASRRLEDQQQVRAALIELATAEWRGPGHDAWVEMQQRLVAEHLELGVGLRYDVRRIEAAALLARRDQTNREVEREAWYRESAAEAALAVAPASVASQAPIAW